MVVRPYRGRRRVYRVPTRHGRANLRRAKRIRRRVPRSFRPRTHSEKVRGARRAKRQIAKAEHQRLHALRTLQHLLPGTKLPTQPPDILRQIKRAKKQGGGFVDIPSSLHWGLPNVGPLHLGHTKNWSKSFVTASGKLENPSKHHLHEQLKHPDKTTFAGPAQKILEQTVRPVHAIAGGIYAAQTGKSPAKGFVRGLENKDEKSFSDVLKKAGAPKGVAAVVGTGLDIGTNPLTYATLGRNIPATLASKEAAELAASRVAAKLPKTVEKSAGVFQKAHKRAFRRAIKQGKLSSEALKIADQAASKAPAVTRISSRAREANRSAKRAAKRAAKGQPETSGITGNFGPLHTSGRASAKLGQKLPKTRAGAAARDFGHVFSPNIAPSDTSRSAFEAFKGSSREARAHSQRGQLEAGQLGAYLKHAVAPEHHAHVIDAIERDLRTSRGAIANLPHEIGLKAGKLGSPEYKAAKAGAGEDARVAATRIHNAAKRVRRLERKAGIATPQASRVGYFPHKLKSNLEQAPPKGARAGYTIKPGYTKGREYRMRLGAANKQIRLKAAKKQGLTSDSPMVKSEEFSTDIPAVVTHRLATSARDVARAHFNRSVVKFGRPIVGGEHIKPGEVVVHSHLEHGKPTLTWHDTEGSQKLANKIVAGEKVEAGDYAIVPEKFVKSKMAGVAPDEGYAAPEQMLDKVTGAWKWVATQPNPAFHARNLMGDAQNAYLRQAGHRLIRNAPSAARGVRRLAKEEKRMQKGEVKGARGPTIAVKGKHGQKIRVPLDAEIRQGVKSGALRQGFTARELGEMTHRGGVRGNLLTRTSQGREDFVRALSYLSARQEGLSAREAAARVAEVHFDYGDLSVTERRVARRVLPFYTWTSRNIPLQAKTLLTRPGKYANIESIREEVGKSQGVSDLPKWLHKYTREFQGRALPVPIKIGGKDYIVSMSGLPASDLNQLPVSLDPKNFGEESMKKILSMLHPLVKDPVELFTNYSFFFRGPLERHEGRGSALVSAPNYVGKFPASWRRKLGIVKSPDRQTGKLVWMWPGKVDYASKLVPGPSNTGQQLATSGSSRRGQRLPQKLISDFTGIRPDPVDAAAVRIEHLFRQRSQVQRQISKLPRGAKGPRYNRLRRRLHLIEGRITKASRRRGDKRPLLQRSGGGGGGSGGIHLGGSSGSGIHLGGSSGGGVHLGGP